MILKARLLIHYLRLLRIPNLFTAVADVMLGFLFVHESLRPVSEFGLLLVSSCCLYSAGMVLNDVFDIGQDTRERPERPLPSGKISLSVAQKLGWGLLLGGVAFGGLAGFVVPANASALWRSGVVAATLAICVLLYDGLLKPTVFGPVVMGSCRLLNVLLGMSTGVVQSSGWLGFDSSQWCVAGGIGVYVAGVTWFARNEAGDSRRDSLIGGLAIISLGLVVLGLFPQTGWFRTGERSLTFLSDFIWPLLVLLLGFSIVRRGLLAVVHPMPRNVQVAVKQCILSLIVLDAAVCLAVRSPWWWSVGILGLLIPTLVLGRWVYST